MSQQGPEATWVHLFHPILTWLDDPSTLVPFEVSLYLDEIQDTGGRVGPPYRHLQDHARLKPPGENEADPGGENCGAGYKSV